MTPRNKIETAWIGIGGFPQDPTVTLNRSSRRYPGEGMLLGEQYCSPARGGERVTGSLSGAGLPDGRHVKQYPREFSEAVSSRRDRAIGLRPKLLIADEPTSALDVTVQRRILITPRR